MRQPLPWIGMWELRFSRCTARHWTWHVPYIGPTGRRPHRLRADLYPWWIGARPPAPRPPATRHIPQSARSTASPS
ncbi:hypothetical protein [Streptomyces sp. NBC_00344]|uniref:hypothetical protein n=1 Tax=Streptomyces sp. NBC_00344 TaxID=2975720 RepID=UPI002E1E9772